ncbi:PBSX family phage terminase large subunit [Eubacterium maltosivorans]|uniref:PBSX family phage terminase large subunit n=1 Tax=Eubacterium maltosivorans TaxID=2041044 RepID=A0A4P9C5V5_EUBML|nr:PBSX family phage terminase large subunit [Eubacterium maltosivorans]QCT70839.1 PBSX family phage terminase large subunit [Eubacterium maltosivorans]
MAVQIKKKKTIPFNFAAKHQAYIRKCQDSTFNFAEGAVRAGKTIDNVYAFAHELKTTKDKIHLATGSTAANAKLNIGDANGFGLEWIFRNQSHWGKYKGNECLYIKGPSTGNRQRIVIFAGGAKADSFKKIRGNSYGMWIATEINLHHEKTIQEAMNRLLAADNRKIFWDLNPDNPKAPIYIKYIDKYAKQDKEGKLLGGYNYEHFTIFDNVNIPEQRIQEIISQYDPASIWYMRDIEGKRCVAEGLIYRIFADSIAVQDSRFLRTEKPRNLQEINIGVDFGGNGSGHSFVATAITPGYTELIALESELHFGDIDPEDLGRLFVSFCQKVVMKYGFITAVFADSAEQVLIRGLRSSAKKAGLSWLKIYDSYKEQINERIRATYMLMSQGRFFIYGDGCESLILALCSAVWDPKEVTKNIRLDDGTSDIDTLDGFEYTFERNIERLIGR